MGLLDNIGSISGGVDKALGRRLKHYLERLGRADQVHRVHHLANTNDKVLARNRACCRATLGPVEQSRSDVHPHHLRQG